MAQRGPVERLVAQAAQLSAVELEELLLALEGLPGSLQTDADEAIPATAAETKPEPTRQGPGSRGGRGHIEQKWINGCGPYLYLRYYKGCENGRCGSRASRSRYGSVYLGKANQDSDSMD